MPPAGRPRKPQNRDLPPGMIRRVYVCKDGSKSVRYMFQAYGGKQTPLGTDLQAALAKWHAHRRANHRAPLRNRYRGRTGQIAEEREVITAKERQDAFMRDFRALLRKHGAECTITDDGKPYGMHHGVAEIAMPSVFLDHVEQAEYCVFRLPNYEDGKPE